MNTDLQHLIDQIQTAAAQRTPLRIRGGGSKDFYGESLQGEVLDTAPCRGIVSYEPSELVVTVRAGTPLAELEAALAEKGQSWRLSRPALATAERHLRRHGGRWLERPGARQCGRRA